VVNEVVLVRRVHDKNDGALPLVVQATVEAMVELVPAWPQVNALAYDRITPLACHGERDMANFQRRRIGRTRSK
jgi:hypothetical protein